MFSRSNLFSFSSISGNSLPYISCSKSGSVSGFLVLSHSFQNVQSCTSNHSVPQITVSVVRQMAHNMHIAYIASCIHVKLKIATKLYHCWLYAVPRTRNPNIRWVRDTGKYLPSQMSWHDESSPLYTAWALYAVCSIGPRLIRQAQSMPRKPL